MSNQTPTNTSNPSGIDPAVERVKGVILDLESAIIPTKCEVFAICGGPVAQLQEDLTALLSRIQVLEEALRPFAVSAGNIDFSDIEDFKVVAHVPAGAHAAAFQKLAALLTAGNFRAARQALGDA